MSSLESAYNKPFRTIPEQIYLLKYRGMDCGSEPSASLILRRYGYYRLSGYWYPYRKRKISSGQPVKDSHGRDVVLNEFEAHTSLQHVVEVYEFDKTLRSLLGEVLATVEIGFRFFIGHKIGKIDPFLHLDAEKFDQKKEDGSLKTTYVGWLEEYTRHENRAQGEFITHFKDKYGSSQLPIWVGTEVMSLGSLRTLFTLMPEQDQRIIAEQLQILQADRDGDFSVVSTWLNGFRLLRNICHHHGRVWNRVFEIVLNAPTIIRNSPQHVLSDLDDSHINNHLYGLLLALRYTLLSIEPDNSQVLDIKNFIIDKCNKLQLNLSDIGFPDDWEDNEIWNPSYSLDKDGMLAGNFIDSLDFKTSSELKNYLDPDLYVKNSPHPPDMKPYPSKIIKNYQNYKAVICIKSGKTSYFPTFQFSRGILIDLVGNINAELFKIIDSFEQEIGMSDTEKTVSLSTGGKYQGCYPTLQMLIFLTIRLYVCWFRVLYRFTRSLK